MIIPLTELTKVFLSISLQSPLHLVGTQQPLTPCRVQYKGWEWREPSTDLPFFAWMNELLSCFSALCIQTSSLLLQSLIPALHCVHALRCYKPWQLSLTYGLLPSCLPLVLQNEAVLPNESQSDRLHSPTRPSGHKTATSENPARKCCQRQQKSRFLFPAGVFKPRPKLQAWEAAGMLFQWSTFHGCWVWFAQNWSWHEYTVKAWWWCWLQCRAMARNAIALH